MKAYSKTAKEMIKVYPIMQTVINTKVIGRMIKYMVKEFTLGKMEINGKDTS